MTKNRHRHAMNMLNTQISNDQPIRLASAIELILRSPYFDEIDLEPNLARYQLSEKYRNRREEKEVLRLAACQVSSFSELPPHARSIYDQAINYLGNALELASLKVRIEQGQDLDRKQLLQLLDKSIRTEVESQRIKRFLNSTCVMSLLKHEAEDESSIWLKQILYLRNTYRVFDHTIIIRVSDQDIHAKFCAGEWLANSESHSIDLVDAVHPEDWPRLISYVRDYLNTNERTFSHFDYRLRRPDADETHSWNNYRCHFNVFDRHPDGQIHLMLGVATDHTERNRAQADLLRADQRLRLALDSARIAFWDWDLEQNSLTWCRNNFALFDYSIGVTMPSYERWLDRIHPDDIAEFDRIHHAAIANHEDFHLEYRIVWTDGSIHWIESYGYAIYNTSGQPIRCLGIEREITERKHQENRLREINSALEDRVAQGTKELRESEEQFRLTFQCSAAGMCIAESHSGRLLKVNRRFCDLVGHPVEGIAGSAIRDYVHPEDIEHYDHRFSCLCAEDINEFSGIYRLMHQSGKVIWGDFLAMLMPETENHFRWVLTSIHDVTEQQIAKDQVKQLQDDLALATRLATISELAGGLAHEITQPLGSTINYLTAVLNYVKNDDLPPEIIDNLHGAVDQTMRAGDIIRRIRDFIRRRQPCRSTILISEVIEDVLKLVAGEIRVLGVHVDKDFPTFIPPLHVDRIQIAQVVLNLIRNALESLANVVDRKRILTVRITRHPSDLLISVIDNGLGLSRDLIGRLFEPLLTTKAEGLGLGLMISRSIIEAHGGKLWFEGPIVSGAIFNFNLPLVDESQRHDR